MAELGGRRVGQNAEFRNGVGRRLQNEAGIYGVVVLGAVHQELVGFRPHAVHGIGLAAAHRAAGQLQSLGQRRSAGQQKAKLGEVAAVEREIDSLAIIHGLTQVVGGLHQHRVSLHIDGLLCGSPPPMAPAPPLPGSRSA